MRGFNTSNEGNFLKSGTIFQVFFKFIFAILQRKKAKKGKKRAAAAMRGVFLLTGGGDCTII